MNSLKVVLVGVRVCAIAILAAIAIRSQQPNGHAGMYVQFRQGPPFPIVASAPNNGSLTVALAGPPGVPFIIVSGPLNPGAATLNGNQTLDLGTPPLFSDVSVLIDGTGPNAPAGFSIPSAGLALITTPMTPNATVALPPLQAIVLDPFTPFGFRLTAASAITLQPSKSILFIQGDYDPGVGTGPTCRLADTSFVGFSSLRDSLLMVGFSAATEVVDSTVVVTPQLLSPHGVVVLGSNRVTFTPSEEAAIENYVRGGGGLVTYADNGFGPGNHASDNQILAHFGLLCVQDNFGGPVVATNPIQHPITAGVTDGVGGEGVSIIEVVGNATDIITNVLPCITNGGACLPYPAVAPSGSPNPTFSACAAVTANLGRVVATYDRNTFFNWPGYGSCLYANSNLQYAVNLFLYAGGY